MTLTITSIIGALTAFFAASSGLVQNDVKRVIAYSTSSQLGYPTNILLCSDSSISESNNDILPTTYKNILILIHLNFILLKMNIKIPL